MKRRVAEMRFLKKILSLGSKRKTIPADIQARIDNAKRAQFLGSVVPPSTLIVGASGSGKSYSTLPEFVEIVERRECAALVFDSHGMFTKNGMLHLEKRKRTERVLYDQLGQFERVLAPRFITPSSADNPIRREAENHANMVGFLEVLWTASGRDDEDWTKMPMLSMYLELGLRLFFNQPESLIPQLFPFVFRLKHPVCHYLIKNTFDEEAREEFEELLWIAKRGNDNLLETKIGAAKRLVRQVFSIPAFAYRMASRMNVGKALRDKKIILIDGSDDGAVPRKAISALFRMWMFACFTEHRRHFTLNGEPLPVVYWLEEAAESESVGPDQISMCREGRKMGASLQIMAQDLEFIDQDIRRAVVASTKRHLWYNPGNAELAIEAARDITIAKLNPQEIHSTTTSERMLHDGFDKELRNSYTMREFGLSTTSSESQVPRFRRVVDTQTKYVGLEDQIMLTAKALLNMKPGWRMSRVSGESVSHGAEYVQRLPDPYPTNEFPGLGRTKLAKAITTSQQNPEFITPTELDTSWARTTTQSPNDGTGQPGTSSTFIPLPTSNSKKQGSTRQRKRRGKGSKGGTNS